MDVFLNKDKKKEDKKYKRAFIYLIVFSIIYLLLSTAIAPKKHNLSVGDIATVDIKAPIDTVDQIATKEKQEEAISKVDKQYTVKSEVKTQAIENVNKLFNKIATENSTSKEEKDKITEIKKVEGFKLNDDEYKILVSLNSSKLSEAQWIVIDTLELVYKDNIGENNYDNLQRAKGVVDSQLSSKNLDRSLEEVLRGICYTQIKPNLFFDKEKTEEKIKEAQKSVPKEIIKKNQIIVKEGEPVTQRQIDLLKELGLLNNEATKWYLFSFIFLGILIALVLFMQYSYIFKVRPDIFKNNKMIILISSINLIILIISNGIKCNFPVFNTISM